MSVEAELRTQLTSALKARDLRTANVIRMVQTKLMERRTAAGFRGEVDDALCIEVISAYKKTLDKAIGEYEKLGERGEDEARELRFEAEVCARYLPPPLGDEILRDSVREAASAIGAAETKDSGRIVGAVMKKHRGRVDAARVKALVEEFFSS